MSIDKFIRKTRMDELRGANMREFLSTYITNTYVLDYFVGVVVVSVLNSGLRIVLNIFNLQKD